MYRPDPMDRADKPPPLIVDCFVRDRIVSVQIRQVCVLADQKMAADWRPEMNSPQSARDLLTL